MKNSVVKIAKKQKDFFLNRFKWTFDQIVCLFPLKALAIFSSFFVAKDN